MCRPTLNLSDLLPGLDRKRQAEDRGRISGHVNLGNGVILVQGKGEGSWIRVHQRGVIFTKPDIFPKQRATTNPRGDLGDPPKGSTELHHVFTPEGTHQISGVRHLICVICIPD